MNYSKANDTSFSLRPEQENSDDSYNTTNITEELDIEPIENKWAKYLNSPKKENSSDTEDPSFDICKIEDTNDISNEKSLCDAINNDSCNFKNTLDDCNIESEDITSETENLCFTYFNYNSSIEDKCNLQESDKTSNDYNAVNIFETYSELDDPLI